VPARNDDALPRALSPSHIANSNDIPQGTPVRRASKRGLNRKTISNLTPNHNPNYVAPSPGKTPQSVHASKSPMTKRTCCTTVEEDEVATEGNQPQHEPPCLRRDKEMETEPVVCASPVLPQPSVSPSAERVCRQEWRRGTHLRDSLLSIDPLRLSCGPDGTINCGGAPFSANIAWCCIVGRASKLYEM
jgi:hypothetical protein